jgi:hypothetical protein
MPKAINLFSDQDSPELVPTLASSVGLPRPEEATVALPDELLADMQRGEVIDISELIPQLASSFEGDAALPTAGSLDGSINPPTGMTDLSSTAVDATALAILYDDDLLLSEGTFL